MAEHALELFGPGTRALTHCNAGGLATGGYGTALGALRRAWEADLVRHVWVDETRPLLQGSRLTAYELAALGVPHTVIADAAAGSLMAAGEVDCVVTGADRIAANGDTANKIGTYMLAVCAKHHDIPFVIAAPSTTLDVSIATGAEIPIEERDASEVTMIEHVQVAPAGCPVFNPAFDVTPGELVAAIVTEKGVFLQPYQF
jgi:methylthioribose-1-phosphate isomerase